MNKPQDWGINLALFDSSTATWGRDLVSVPKINSGSIFYDNLPNSVQKGLIKQDGTVDMVKVESYFNNKVQQLIDGVVKVRKVLNEGATFNILQASPTQEYLQRVPMLALQHIIRNSFWETTNTNSLQTSQITIQQDLTGWLNSSDMQGTAAWNALMNSQVHKYELIANSNGDVIGTDGTRYDLIYNGRKINVQFKTGELLVDVEIDSNSDSSLWTKANTTKYIDAKVASSISNSHKEFAGAYEAQAYDEIATLISTFNTGSDITLTKDGQTFTFNKTTSKTGDIIQVNVVGKRSEELMVNPNNQLEQLTFNNADYAILEQVAIDNVNQNLALDGVQTQLDALETNKIDASTVYRKTETYSKAEIDGFNTAMNSKITANTTKNTAQDTRLDTLETKVNPMEARFVAIETKDTTQETRLTNVEIKATNAESQANDYAANKADFVRVSDIASSIVNTVDIALTESGNNVVATLPVAATAGMTNGKLVRMKLIRTNVSPSRVNYLEDDLDNNTITQNTLALEGTSYECSATLEPTTLTISGLAQAQRTILVGNYRLVQLEQTSSQAGTAIDATARQAAAAADTKAVAAQTDATQALTKVNAIDLTPLTTNIANNTAAIAVNTTNIAANTTAIAGKQSVNDATLTTTSKAVVGAINEINAKVNLDDTTLVALETLLGL